jgi:hypothetical protein
VGLPAMTGRDLGDRTAQHVDVVRGMAAAAFQMINTASSPPVMYGEG